MRLTARAGPNEAVNQREGSRNVTPFPSCNNASQFSTPTSLSLVLSLWTSLHPQTGIQPRSIPRSDGWIRYKQRRGESFHLIHHLSLSLSLSAKSNLNTTPLTFSPRPSILFIDQHPRVHALFRTNQNPSLPVVYVGRHMPGSLGTGRKMVYLTATDLWGKANYLRKCH